MKPNYLMTYILDNDFYKTAVCLTMKHLNKQIRDAFFIAHDKTLLDPLAEVWNNHKTCLKFYFNTMLKEYRAKGRKSKFDLFRIPDYIKMPEWVMDNKLHFSHAVHLLRENHKHYSQYFSVPGNCSNYPVGFYWPIPVSNVQVQTTKAWELFFNNNPVENKLVFFV